MWKILRGRQRTKRDQRWFLFLFPNVEIVARERQSYNFIFSTEYYWVVRIGKRPSLIIGTEILYTNKHKLLYFGLGNIVQWHRNCLACVRPCVKSLAMQKKKKPKWNKKKPVKTKFCTCYPWNDIIMCSWKDNYCQFFLSSSTFLFRS